MKVLANDGIDASAKKALEALNFYVSDVKVPQENLISEINSKGFEVLLVRSATQVDKTLISSCKGLKLVGRAGVGMDNIDQSAAKEHHLTIFNTPASSSASVAELVVAHMFSLSRFLHVSNRDMPAKGLTHFNELKKNYTKGVELNGKTLGIVGFGRIGQALAKYALGLGMKVIAYDLMAKEVVLKLNIGGQNIDCPIKISSMDDVIKNSDFISFHVPKQKDGKALIAAEDMKKMKKGVFLINTSRGGVIHEQDLLEALNSGQVAGAGLDVFENEPKPLEALLQHPKISLTPHTGASTLEAQERIGEEIVEHVRNYYKL